MFTVIRNSYNVGVIYSNDYEKSLELAKKIYGDDSIIKDEDEISKTM